MDFDIIDKFEKVTDKDGPSPPGNSPARRASFSAGGSAFQGLRQLEGELKPTDLAVVLFHDHGSRYVGKVYNDDWMREQGWLDWVGHCADALQSASAPSPASCRSC